MKTIERNRAGVVQWLAFHAAATVLLLLFPAQIIFGASIWKLGANELQFLGLLASGFWGGALGVLLFGRRVGPLRLLEAAIYIAASMGVVCSYILVTKGFHSRPVLLLAFLGALIFETIYLYAGKRLVRLSIYACSLGALATQALGGSLKSALYEGPSPTEPVRSEASLRSALYGLRATFLDDITCSRAVERCKSPRNGGGIEPIRDGLLLATGDGALAYAEYDREIQSPTVRWLHQRIPINSDRFRGAGNESSEWLFRVTDVLVRESNGVLSLFAAHHYWHEEKGCFTLRLSELTTTLDALIGGDSGGQWRTVFDTHPCLPIQMPEAGSHSQRPFSGDESGGRMVMLDEETLLLSVGDHLFNGFDKKPMLAQDETSHYGKTIVIDVARGTGRTFTKGHRNPQGLFRDGAGNIWETEHGPQGGDELNQLVDGANYGWPLVTLGTDYGRDVWPLSKSTGRHDDFVLAKHAWVPSTAVSNLYRIGGTEFRAWAGDLIVGSYLKTLWRVRLDGDRVLYVEPITIRGANARIRDVLEDEYGHIVLWMDGGTIAILRPVNEQPNEDSGETAMPNTGADLFRRLCSSCHAVDPTPAPMAGPNLRGIVGRNVARADGYSYSAALSRIGGTWAESTLNQFLRDPQTFAPGTAMLSPGIEDDARRTALIDFLKHPE